MAVQGKFHNGAGRELDESHARVGGFNVEFCDYSLQISDLLQLAIILRVYTQKYHNETPTTRVLDNHSTIHTELP